MNYFKKAMLWGLKYGIPIGLAMGFTVILIYSCFYGTSFLSFEYLMIEYVIFAIFGFSCSAMAAVYTVKGWSILKKTIVYFIALLCVFLPCFIIGAWMPASPIAIEVYVGIFVLFFLCFWLTWYFYWKAEVKKINFAIKNRK